MYTKLKVIANCFSRSSPSLPSGKHKDPPQSIAA
jgi:hypothetical protein